MNTEINTWLPYLLWPLLAIGSAYMQGCILPAVKRTPPGPEADKQARGLHLVGAVVYLLPLGFAPTVPLVAAALLSRWVLFDPALNATQGLPLFSIGYTAATDQLLRRIAGTRADMLSAALRLSAAAAALVALWWLQ